MAKTNIFKKTGKTYIFKHQGGGGESGITVTPLTVTENGTYTSAAGQAYSPVTVNVPSSVGGELFCWTYTDENTGNTYYAYTASPNPSVRDAVYIAGGESGVGLSPIDEDYEVYSFTDGKLVIAYTYSHEPISEDEYTRDNTYDIDLGELEIETNRTYSITQNGTIVINPSSGNDVMEKVTATVNVASAEIEANKAVTIDASSYSAPVEVTPTSPNDAMAKTTVTLTNIPSGSGGILYAWYSDGLSEARYTTFNTAPASLSSDNKIYKFDVETSGDPFVNGLEEETVSDYVKTSDNEFTCTLDGTSRTFHKSTSSYEGEDIIISNEIDIEANKAATIDVSQYSTPVEITPTSGKDGMAKTTVTLSNIPTESDIETEKTVSITQNGTYTINPTTGKDAMAKVTATVNVATATVEGTNLILSSGSVSGNTLNL